MKVVQQPEKKQTLKSATKNLPQLRNFTNKEYDNHDSV